MTKEANNSADDQIQRVLKRVGPIETPPEEMSARVRAAVHGAWVEEVNETKTQRPGQSRWFQYAAAVGLVAVVLFWGVTQNDVEVEPVVATIDSTIQSVEWSVDGADWQRVSENSIRAGRLIRVTTPTSFTFSEGMNIRADSSTEFEVVDGQQLNLRTGAVYLDSYNRHPGQSFLVATAYGEATDIGTQFMVSASVDGWSVQVREGAVDVVDDNLAQSLSAGEKLIITSTNIAQSSDIKGHDKSWAWTQMARPAYEIEGKRLDDYLIWVSREIGYELVYGSEQAVGNARDTILHGSIRQLTARESLGNVLRSTDLELLSDDDGVLLIDVTGADNWNH